MSTPDTLTLITPQCVVEINEALEVAIAVLRSPRTNRATRESAAGYCERATQAVKDNTLTLVKRPKR